VVLYLEVFVHSARTGHPHILSSSQHTLSCSLAELPSQIVMPEPESKRKDPYRICGCGCNCLLSRSAVYRHERSLASPPPLKRRRIAHVQGGQESFITRPRKEKQSRTGNNSSTFHSHADASSSSSDHSRFSTPQVHSSSFEFNPSLPLLDPPAASNLLQSPGDQRTEASGLFVDNVSLNLHARTRRTGQSDDEDSEDDLEGDVVAADSVDHESDDFWNGEDVATESDDVDPREGIISDRDLLIEKFIVEAEELGKFEHCLSNTSTP
jgi:hypothetical protein